MLSKCSPPVQNENMAEEEESYPLHECVFSGDVRKLSALIRTHDVAKRDKHGNTALHLAVMLGRKECVHLLLAHGAPVKVKNLAGWSPLAEAISYGDRQTISSLVRKLKQQAREQMEERRPNLVQALNQMGDFYMELKWDFQSWVPLVSRILPSDICRIHKRGSSIRLDTTLVDFNDMRWERGDISFLFNGDVKPSQSLTVLDNIACIYQRVRYEETEMEIEDEVDILMSSDIMAAQMSTKSITFTRAQSGWIFREDRKEMVGPFHSEFYVINGMLLESRKRREHLSEEDLQKNKAIMESLTKGNTQGLDTNGEQPVRRLSLTPPPESRVSWREYISAPVGEHPTLGRQLVHKESSKAFKATVAMICHGGAEPCDGRCCWVRGGQLDPAWSHDMYLHGDMVWGVLSRQSSSTMEIRLLCCMIKEKKTVLKDLWTTTKSPDFPLSVDMLLNVLEVITPFKHFNKLREFVQMKLPPGFPVKIDIPILPAITAKITFQEFAFRNDIKLKLFEIPPHYVEDPTRFPDL